MRLLDLVRDKLESRRVRALLACSCGKKRELSAEEMAQHQAAGSIPECCPGRSRAVVYSSVRKSTP